LVRAPIVSRIFLSHSSANNAEAMALRDWLLSQGFDDLFLDLDPERGLKAGQKWQAELKRAAERCELVIFLVSPDWAASKWCVAEFFLAKSLNKRIFGVLVAPTPFAELPTELTAEYQLVDLTKGKRDHKASVTPPSDDKPVAVAYGDCHGSISDNGWGRERQPIVNVDWDDAQTYVRWLARTTGKNYRLLSEAEWEYVARSANPGDNAWWGIWRLPTRERQRLGARQAPGHQRELE
jgi:hypothetical protein